MKESTSHFIVIGTILALTLITVLFFSHPNDTDDRYDFEFYERYSEGVIDLESDLGSEMKGRYYMMDREDGTFLVIDAHIRIGDIDQGDLVDRRPILLFPNTMIVKEIRYGGFDYHDVACWTGYDGRPYSSFVYAGRNAFTEGDVTVVVLVSGDYWSDDKEVRASVGKGSVSLHLEPKEKDPVKGR